MTPKYLLHIMKREFGIHMAAMAEGGSGSGRGALRVDVGHTGAGKWGLGVDFFSFLF